MSRTRQTQHKPKRDEQRAQELSDIKRENQKLKRQVARLRKELEHHIGAAVEPEPEIEETAATLPTHMMCPNCQNKLEEKQLGPSKWQWCECGFRRKL